MSVVVGMFFILAATACGASSDIDQEDLTTKYVDGTRCIILKPSSSSNNGVQMQCDFKEK